MELNGAGPRHASSRKYFFFWLALTLVGLLFAAANYLTGEASGHGMTMAEAVGYNLFRFWFWLLLTPAILAADRLLRRRTQRWTLLIAAHLPVAAALVCIFTLGFVYACWLLPMKESKSFGEMLAMYASSQVLLGVVLYKMVLTFHYAIEYYDKYRDERLRSAVLETRAARAELQALKMQLQPHFLFNALNSISSLTLEEPRAAVRMIARLGDFLRKTIDNNGTQEVTLQDELEFLRCYLEIEQVRFRDRLRVTYDTEPAALAGMVPNLILQPMVENAIKHGIATTLQAGRIAVRARCDERWLEVQVENDGPGFASRPVPLKEGIGLGNTRERLQQLYHQDFHLSLEPRDGGGARMTLRIPRRMEAAGAPAAAAP